MFSEETIKRTKERLVEYIQDNAYSFTRKNGGWSSSSWSFTNEELSARPIQDAMQVLGTATATDVIVSTLDSIRGSVRGLPNKSFQQEFDLITGSIYDEDYYDDYDEDDYGYDGDYNGFYDEDDEDEDEYKVFISANSPLSLYEWITSNNIKSNDVTEPVTEFENEDEEVSDKDMVNHPSHYNQGKFETIDIIEDIVRGYDDPVEAYLVGTTLKYLARAPFKGAKKQDLEKAGFYLKRAIEKQQ